MFDDSGFLPHLLVKGRDELGGRLHRPLAATGDPLLLGFTSKGLLGGIRAVTADDAQKRRLSLEGAEFLARKNLAGRANRPAWSVVKSLAGSWLERQGDHLVAADILDSELRADAHRRLGSDDLVVALPSRHVLLAAPASLAPVLAGLSAVIAKTAEESALVADLWRLHAGDLGERLAVAASAAAEPAAEDHPLPEIRDGSATVPINATTVEEVEETAIAILKQHLPALCRQPEFAGVVVISVNGYLFPATDANKVALGELAEKLDDHAAWKDLTTTKGKAISVRLRLDA
ncbi:hypothetical protein LBMAG53_36760 [Planctomycetota bacterium]|nr:hypothetical protein LBMAG53_36760 [Planctomycetota bacterium]